VTDQQRGSLFWPAAVLAGVLVVVFSRISRSLVQPYGVDGAEYIEHLSRLEVLIAFRQLLDSRDFLAFLREADNAFPPLLHLLSLPFGAVLGHRAEDALLVGPLWLVVLAAATGLVAGRLSGSSRAAAAAASSTLLVPALHGFATRYYYDLPMTALLWLGLAVLLIGRGGREVPVGVLGGFVLFMAALIKWQALPIIAIMLVALALTPEPATRGRTDPAVGDRRGLLLLPALAGAVCLVASIGYLTAIGSHNSLIAMLRDVSASTAADVLADSAQGVSLGLVAPDALRLLFYPLRLISSVLSPLLAMMVAPLLVVWFRGRGHGRGFLLLLGVGQMLFLLAVVPPLDDRFLVPLVPAVVIAAVLGWEQLSARRRSVVAAAVLLGGLAVAMDFHTDFNLPGSEKAHVLIAAKDRPGIAFFGVGAGGSVEQRGWSRVDQQRTSRFRTREQLWDSLVRCRVQTLRVAPEDPMVGDSGDLFWFHYRATYAALAEPPPTPSITMDAQPASYGPPICRESLSGQTELAVSGVAHSAEPVMPPCTDQEGWTLAGRLPLLDLDRDVAIFTPKGHEACDALSGAADENALSDSGHTTMLTDGGCILRADGLNLAESLEPEKSWTCVPVVGQEEPWHPSSCNSDYLQFSRRAAHFSMPVPDCKDMHGELATMWEQGWDQPRPPIPGLDPEPLREDLRATLNIAALIDGDEQHASLDARPLEVVTIGERDGGGYRELELVLIDPYVGRFHALLLLPKGEGPFPAVLALPGHGESAAEHRDNRFGWLFPEEGIAALILDTRGYDTGPAEHEASLALLCGGFSMMTVRIYEALLALKFLRGRTEICNARIGLVGHSGGSVTGNLLIRLWPGIKAYVSDLTAIHFNVGDPLEGDLHGQIGDETHPGLARLSSNLNMLETAGTPVLTVPYGYSEGPVAMFEFFKERLAVSEEKQ
jgi:hypothetical protein